jgi:hypothetical protein
LVHFGIGTYTAIDKIVIEWPSGIVDEFIDPEINDTHIYLEGSSILGTDDFTKESIVLYPNPTSDLINFSLRGLTNTPVNVVDVNGRVVLQTIISANDNINVSSLQSGVYFVNLEIEGQSLSYKFVKR